MFFLHKVYMAIAKICYRFWQMIIFTIKHMGIRNFKLSYQMNPEVNIFWVVAFFMNLPLYGQTNVTKEYLDHHLRPVKQEEASFYRFVPKDSDKVFNGVATYYYISNGIAAQSVYAKGEFKDNIRTGKWEWWYISGQPKEVGYFEKKPTFYETKNALKSEAVNNTFRIESFWDSTGVQLVKNGNGKFVDYETGLLSSEGSYLNGLKQGEWKGTFEKGSYRYTENYKNGELISGISYDNQGQATTYTELEILPDPDGGMNEFLRYLTRSLRYPKIARKKGIEGKVLVQFYLNKDGSISDVVIDKGIGGGCDEEAMRVVSECPDWKPAIHRGQQLRVKMTLPIVFKLG
jgi:TonB family protein